MLCILLYCVYCADGRLNSMYNVLYNIHPVNLIQSNLTFFFVSMKRFGPLARIVITYYHGKNIRAYSNIKYTNLTYIILLSLPENIHNMIIIQVHVSVKAI